MAVLPDGTTIKQRPRVCRQFGDPPAGENARGGRWRSRALLIAAVALIVVMSSVPSAAGSGLNPPGGEEPAAGPLAVSVLSAPQAVLGADGRNHLVYELRLSNISRATTTVDAVQVLAAGRSLGSRLTGRQLRSAFRLDSGKTDATTLNPGMGATIFMDATFAAHQRPPRSLRHRIWLRYRDPSNGNRVELSFTGASTGVVRTRAIEIAPPLLGPRWMVASGCCGWSPHRQLNLIDGQIYVSERFAIDFVQLNPQDRLFTGPKDQLSSYACFGVPVHAVANGTVVAVQDGLRDQVPGKDPPGVTVQNAGGNYVVERIGARRFAFYAHLQPGSLRVRRGQRLQTGQVIGLLGNSGNSTGPHLHFHIMDMASPLQSNGVPFTFRGFRGQGVVTSEDPVIAGERAPIDRHALAGVHRHQLPLGDQLVDFG